MYIPGDYTINLLKLGKIQYVEKKNTKHKIMKTQQSQRQ